MTISTTVQTAIGESPPDKPTRADCRGEEVPCSGQEVVKQAHLGGEVEQGDQVARIGCVPFRQRRSIRLSTRRYRANAREDSPAASLSLSRRSEKSRREPRRLYLTDPLSAREALQ